MTYEECRVELEKILKMKIFIDRYSIDVDYKNECGYELCRINSKKLYAINTSCPLFKFISDDLKCQVIDVLFELVKTPQGERIPEQERKYYLKHKFFNFGDDSYLRIPLPNSLSETSSDSIWMGWNLKQNEFTREEINNLKKKYNVNLEDFDEISTEEVDIVY